MVLRKLSKRLSAFLIILISSILIGYLLLVFVYCIPQRFLLVNLANSVPVLERDDLEDIIFGYPSSKLDVFTDGAMLNIALHTIKENPFKRAAACYQYIYSEKSPAQGFIAYFVPEEPYGDLAYFWYWHGFLVFLKPLLLFFNYSDIRLLNCVLQTSLIALTVYSLTKRKLTRYIPALMITYLFLMPLTLPLSMQYSSVFYVGWGSLACLMLSGLTPSDERIFSLFLMTGILTSYLDLLTYPIFTLGIPLVGVLILCDTSEQKRKAGSFLGCILSWAFGYVGMWVGKILISFPFYGIYAFQKFYEQIRYRSLEGAANEGVTFDDAITSNIFMYKNRLFLMLLIAYTIAVAGYFVFLYTRGRKPFISVKLLPLFAVVILMPFLWYMVAAEHSNLHSFMTYKALTVAVFGYCAGLMAVIQA